MKKKILDAMAAFCLLFDVDWDTDFEDDAFVMERRKKQALASGRFEIIQIAPKTSAV